LNKLDVLAEREQYSKMLLPEIRARKSVIVAIDEKNLKVNTDFVYSSGRAMLTKSQTFFGVFKGQFAEVTSEDTF